MNEPWKPTHVVPPGGLDVRAAPDTRLDPASTVAEDTVIGIIETSGRWSRIRTESGQEGWVDRPLVAIGAADDLVGPAAEPPAESPAAAPPTADRSWWVAGAVVAAAVLVIIVVLIVNRGEPSDPPATTHSAPPMTTAAPVPETTRAVTTTGAPTTTAIPITTAAPPTTTAAPPTTTEPPVDDLASTTGLRYRVDQPSAEPPEVEPQTPPANYAGHPGNGSGCVVGGADTLPDGIWFGYVIDLSVPQQAGTDPADLLVSFDLACFYSGAAAVDEAAFSDQTATGGLFVRNIRVRALDNPASWDTPAHVVDTDDRFGKISFIEWLTGGSPNPACATTSCGIWVYVNHGRITEIVEQHWPGATVTGPTTTSTTEPVTTSTTEPVTSSTTESTATTTTRPGGLKDPTQPCFTGVAPSGSGMVAVGYNRSTDWDRINGNVDAVVATSGDGMTWTLITDPTIFGGPGYQWMLSMTAGGPGFVAVGDDFRSGSSDAAVWTSTDGSVWTRVPHQEAIFGGRNNQRMWGVTIGGPGLVAAGYDGSWGDVDAAVWTSINGTSWSRVPHDEATFGGTGHQVIEGIASGPMGLIAVGHDSSGGDVDAAIWTSPDGVSWTRVPHDESVFGGRGEQRAFAATPGGPGWVVVGDDDGDAAVWTSGDGVAWTQISDPAPGRPGTARILGITTGGPGLVAGGYTSSGNNAAVWTSPDGVTWARVSHDEAVFGGDGGQRIEAITTGGAGLVAVGGNDSGAGYGEGVVWVSADGWTWTRVAELG